MNEQQKNAIELFENVKNKCTVEKIGKTMAKYDFTENGWMYTFFTDNGILKKCECFNHRELIEIYL